LGKKEKGHSKQEDSYASTRERKRKSERKGVGWTHRKKESLLSKIGEVRLCNNCWGRISARVTEKGEAQRGKKKDYSRIGGDESRCEKRVCIPRLQKFFSCVGEMEKEKFTVW